MIFAGERAIYLAEYDVSNDDVGLLLYHSRCRSFLPIDNSGNLLRLIQYTVAHSLECMKESGG
jgi:hypothetical protein